MSTEQMPIDTMSLRLFFTCSNHNQAGNQGRQRQAPKHQHRASAGVAAGLLCLLACDMLAMASAQVDMAWSPRCPECIRNDRIDTPPASVIRCRTPENDDITSSASAHRFCTCD